MTEQQQQSDTASNSSQNSIIPFQINSWQDSQSSSTGEHELQELSPATPTQSFFDEISSPNDHQEQQPALSLYSTVSDTSSRLDEYSTQLQQVSPPPESSATTTTITDTTSCCSSDDSQVTIREKSISEKLASVERFKSKFGRGSGNDISLVAIGMLMDKFMDLCYATFLQCTPICGHLTDSLFRSNLQYYKINCLYFNEMSHGPFLFFENLQNEYMAALLLPGYNHIETSLPPSLRYLHAGCLPLGPKTRKAHVVWSIHYFKFITFSFIHHFCCIYDLLARNADKRYQDMSRVIKSLIKIESNIILNHEENKVSYPFNYHHHHQC